MTDGEDAVVLRGGGQALGGDLVQRLRVRALRLGQVGQINHVGDVLELAVGIKRHGVGGVADLDLRAVLPVIPEVHHGVGNLRGSAGDVVVRILDTAVDVAAPLIAALVFIVDSRDKDRYIRAAGLDGLAQDVGGLAIGGEALIPVVVARILGVLLVPVVNSLRGGVRESLENISDRLALRRLILEVDAQLAAENGGRRDQRALFFVVALVVGRLQRELGGGEAHLEVGALNNALLWAGSRAERLETISRASSSRRPCISSSTGSGPCTTEARHRRRRCPDGSSRQRNRTCQIEW